MKKQSAVGLFFSMFLRGVVIILGILILVFGIIFITKVVKSKNKQSSGPATTVSDNVLTESEAHDELLTAETTEATTQEVTTEEAPPSSSTDKTILVLNSTEVVGLAGSWCEKLGGYGYANTQASDYSTPLEQTKIVAVNDGDGKDLMQYFNNPVYEVGTITSGTSASTSGVDIVIIIGTNDSNQ